MINYSLLIAVLISMLLTRLRLHFGSLLAIFVFATFLIFSPDTGEDYSFYKEGYEGITFTNDFPFVFGVDSLTIDQGFLWWMGGFRLFFSSYNVFLSLNFILAMYVFRHVLKKHYMAKKSDIDNLLYLAFPVIIPVAFYWSPRSGPSLFAMLLLVSTLHSRYFIYSTALVFFATAIHSQYVPNVIGLLIYYFLIGKNLRENIFSAFGASLIVVVPLICGDLLPAFVSSLDAELNVIFSVAVEKVHYFSDGSTEGHLRYSFLLILILEIFIIYFLFQDASHAGQNKVIYLLVFSVAFSLVVNSLFWNSAHLASRVARFSDWTLATLGVVYLVRKMNSRNLGGLVINFIGISSVLLYFDSIYYVKN